MSVEEQSLFDLNPFHKCDSEEEYKKMPKMFKAGYDNITSLIVDGKVSL